MNRRRLLARLLTGNVKNVSFNDLRALAEGFGFQLDRVSGSPHVFVHPTIPAILNLQSVGGQAKPYQIRQLLRVIERYGLSLEGERE